MRAEPSSRGTVWGAVTSEARCDAARGCQEVDATALAIAPDGWLLQCRGGARADAGEIDAGYQGCSVHHMSPSGRSLANGRGQAKVMIGRECSIAASCYAVFRLDQRAAAATVAFTLLQNLDGCFRRWCS